MSTNSFAHRGRSLLCAVLYVALATACDSAPAPTSPSPSPSTSPSPSPTPTPTPRPEYTATPVPFNLTQSRTFDILGWDYWSSAPTPSASRLRWNAAVGEYEVLASGYGDWSRLEALRDVQSGGTPYEYDVFGSGGTKLPFFMIVRAPPAAVGYVGWAQIHESNFPHTYFAFGIATEPSGVPVRGRMTCSFGEDEIGDGGLTFDFAAGTVAGWAEPFWGGGVRYELVQTSFAPGATTFAATFGSDGVLEGRFFGPRAVNVAVRAKGGGQGLAAVRGIMTGVCKE